MADEKISALTDGSPLQSTDEFIIARSGSSLKLPGSALGGAFSGARVYNSGATISIPNSSLTAISFNAENFDTDSYHESVTHPTRLTVPGAGEYLVGGGVLWAANGTGWRSLRVRVNGTTDIVNEGIDSPSGADAIGQPLSTLVSLSAADYLELIAFQTSGGSLNIFGEGTSGVGYSPVFWIAKL